MKAEDVLELDNPVSTAINRSGPVPTRIVKTETRGAGRLSKSYEAVAVLPDGPNERLESLCRSDDLADVEQWLSQPGHKYATDTLDPDAWAQG